MRILGLLFLATAITKARWSWWIIDMVGSLFGLGTFVLLSFPAFRFIYKYPKPAHWPAFGKAFFLWLISTSPVIGGLLLSKPKEADQPLASQFQLKILASFTISEMFVYSAAFLAPVLRDAMGISLINSHSYPHTSCLQLFEIWSHWIFEHISCAIFNRKGRYRLFRISIYLVRSNSLGDYSERKVRRPTKGRSHKIFKWLCQKKRERAWITKLLTFSRSLRCNKRTVIFFCLPTRRTAYFDYIQWRSPLSFRREMSNDISELNDRSTKHE